ncbi:MAG TPA: hypothetical protein VN903_01435, partial [Polyangia bacterium]|nr:hypothetical protein [Polyangia bacterium]
MADPLPVQGGILDPNNLSFASFIGGAAPQSMADLQRRRAVANALAMQKRGFPKNIGEGLTSLGEAVGDRMAESRLTAAENAYTSKQAADPLFSTTGPVGAPTSAVAPVPAPARVPAPAPVPGVPAVPGPRTDATDPVEQRAKIAALLQGGTAPGVPSENPTVAGVAPPQTGSPASDDDGLWPARMSAVGGIESGGRKDPYRTVGIQTKYGPALGKYGITAANVGPWSQAALGQALTPEQFLADDNAQDAIFKHRFGTYVAKFGEEGAARAWYGGPGNINKTNLMDDHGRLTIGGYGQDYLRRLQGAATATSGAAPAVSDPGGTVTDEGDNPPTPTTIQPIRVAQARGVPGPADQPTPVPQLTPEQRQLDPGFAISSGTPVAPRKQDTFTPEEMRGYEIIKKYPGDERAHEFANRLIKFGESKREAEYTRAVEEYKLKYGTHEKEALRRAEENSPLKQAELRTKLADEDKRRRLGGISDEEWQKGLAESRKNVEGVPAASMALKAAREDLTQGKMFTGIDAEFQLAKAKAKAALGWDPDPRIRATEAFKAEVAPIVAAARSSLVGNAQISNADLKAAERAAAGDITLDAESIKRVFNLIERINTEKVIAHNRQLRTYAGNDEAAQRGAYGRY